MAMLTPLHGLRLWSQRKQSWRDPEVTSFLPCLRCMTSMHQLKRICFLWLAEEKRDWEESVWSQLLPAERSRKLGWAWILCFTNHCNIKGDGVHSWSFWSFCRKCLTLAILSSILTPRAQMHYKQSLSCTGSSVLFITETKTTQLRREW